MISRRISPCIFLFGCSSCALKRTPSKYSSYERFVVYVIRLHGRRCGKCRRKIHEYSVRRTVCGLCCVTYVVGECARTQGIYTYTRKAYGPFARKPCPGYGAEEGGRRKEVAMFFPLDVSLCFLFAIFHRETFSASLDPLLRKSRFDPRRGVSRRLSIIRVRSF